MPDLQQNLDKMCGALMISAEAAQELIQQYIYIF